MEKMNEEEEYRAIVENNASYDGVFFYAVKSTGIFCRPSCKSKTPKRDNVTFFDTAEEAMQAGYRPCKRCRSDLITYEPMKEIAEQVKALIDKMFQENAELNQTLTKLGVSGSRMVDIFKAVYGMTPKSYMDALRLKEAKRLLEDTLEPVVDIAYAVGFGSVSAFYRFFKENEKKTPSMYRKEKEGRGERAIQDTK